MIIVLFLLPRNTPPNSTTTKQLKTKQIKFPFILRLRLLGCTTSYPANFLAKLLSLIIGSKSKEKSSPKGRWRKLKTTCFSFRINDTSFVWWLRPKDSSICSKPQMQGQMQWNSIISHLTLDKVTETLR